MTLAVSTVIANPNFELGDTGWIKGTGWFIDDVNSANDGIWCATVNATVSGSSVSFVSNQNCVPVAVGQSITATCAIRGSIGHGPSGNGAACVIIWLDGTQTPILYSYGNGTVDANAQWEQSTVTATAPAGAVYAQIAGLGNAVQNGSCSVDSFSWSYVNNQTVTLTSPANGSTYTVGDAILLEVDISGTSPAPVSVAYYDSTTLLVTTTSADWSYNTTTLTAGSHSITAVVTFADTSTITTSANVITVNSIPVTPITREFKASNAYAYLATANFVGLSAAIPATAIVTGVVISIDYIMNVLVRSKDIGITDPLGSNPNVAFDICNGANFEATLMSQAGSAYTITGAPLTTNIPLVHTDFTITEQETSNDPAFTGGTDMWTAFAATEKTATIGTSTSLFGLPPILAGDFIARTLALRFFPQLLPKPIYADTGDCCYRVFLDKVRVQVYFNAGSSDYYFASSDLTQVIEGVLVSSNVSTGAFVTGDAAGQLQLQPTLTIKAGSQTYIGDTWGIYAAYPPEAANKIGDVAVRLQNDGCGMSYNGLPSYSAVTTNRSRYKFVTADFYAVAGLNSIYGCNGVGRAFAYNTQFFYTIWTQPTASLDMARHIAYNQGSLAIGFLEGRVDLSVPGQPYNFSGELGASEWTIGDQLSGLSPLSGTILGIFGNKSIWGLSGSTSANFSLQVIAPKIGAIEYTVADMGTPVYANSYGIYVLQQTEQYGDYAGSPMSQDISPWLRPRLIRSLTSNKEIVCAWPVRTKNQYRVAFSDGYILSMTLNFPKDYTLNLTLARQQVAPVFSHQNYFISPPDSDPVLGIPMLEYPCIVPAAVSSELDSTGQERIHIANVAPRTVGAS
jgi:hypothetical protein